MMGKVLHSDRWLMRKKSKVDLVVVEMRSTVNKLKMKSKLSSYERTQMGLLATRLSENLGREDDPEVARLEWMLIFLEGDVEWKAKYKEVFKRDLKVPVMPETPKKTPKARFRTRSETA